MRAVRKGQRMTEVERGGNEGAHPMSSYKAQNGTD